MSASGLASVKTRLLELSNMVGHGLEMGGPPSISAEPCNVPETKKFSNPETQNFPSTS